MRYLPLSELERIAEQRGLQLCPTCAALYAPCVAVTLEWTAREIAHILPLVYILDPSWGSVRRLCLGGIGGWLCDGREPMIPLHGVFCTCYTELKDYDFATWLLQRYPRLSNEPWSKSVLNQLGIDLEAEIAMWQLSE